ncbi:MAG: SAM-dependent chlorinase/fluorinase [Actinomycetota bacterium]|nr:SAM-dependent chlorinase/fluorinase [Actinomycetota bacterium]
MLLHVVADYGIGDLAFAEVHQHLARRLPEAAVQAVSVPPFDTVSAGFCVAQLALSDGPSDRVVYVNVAPRQDVDAPREGNAGEGLAAVRLESGVLVVGVASGASLAFLAAEGAALRAVRVPAHGSQFRSRDVFPDAVAALARGDDELLGEPLVSGPAPHRCVVYTDGYGNVKTSWHKPPAGPGTRVRVRIGEAAVEAVVTDGVFTVPAGEVAFAPGSSGWPTAGGQRLFFEVFARGTSAAALFGLPPAGTPVEVEPV